MRKMQHWTGTNPVDGDMREVLVFVDCLDDPIETYFPEDTVRITLNATLVVDDIVSGDLGIMGHWFTGPRHEWRRKP